MKKKFFTKIPISLLFDILWENKDALMPANLYIHIQSFIISQNP
jgi:hypothetical protein